MSKQVALIFALLMTSAAADDYRSYREAYAGVDWPKSIASAEQCQQLILSVVRQFGFTDAEVRTSRWTGEPALSVKDQTRHFSVAFSCDSKKKSVTIDVDGLQNQIGTASSLLDRLINSFSAQ
jgi:hypothetical protein